MWSCGCLAAEVFLGQALFHDDAVHSARDVLSKIFDMFGGDQAFAWTDPDLQRFGILDWWLSLPRVKEIVGKSNRFRKWLVQKARMVDTKWKPPGCPSDLADFVAACLRLQPGERITAASACRHLFVIPQRTTTCIVANKRGKIGRGSVQRGDLQDEVVNYLCQCAEVQRLIALALHQDFGPGVSAKCMKEEMKGHNKAEFPYLLEPLDPEKSVRGRILERRRQPSSLGLPASPEICPRITTCECQDAASADDSDPRRRSSQERSRGVLAVQRRALHDRGDHR
jgi:hypothetical protein